MTYWKCNVHTSGRSDNLLNAGLVKLSQPIAEWSGGVDDSLQGSARVVWTLTKRQAYSTSHIPLLASHLVLESSSDNPLLSALADICLLVQLDDFSVVGNDRTMLHGSHGQSDVHSGVVVLTWPSQLEASPRSAKLTHRRSRRHLQLGHPS